MAANPEITLLLQKVNEDGPQSLDRLIPIVYNQLKAIASNQMKKERRDHTLSPTALVHEAYLKLVDQKNVNWQNRAHFFAISAQAMRRILINYAQSKMTAKRGGGQVKVTFDEQSPQTSNLNAEKLLDLNKALEKLARLDEKQAKIVEMRYFGGLTNTEIAEVLKVSETTVQRGWSVARAWLNRELSEN
jgi:RNA polymerase sigma factor (TIGR02999 family)